MMKQIMRVKQLADQTFSRSGKPEELSDELQAAERKVEQMKSALQVICKRLGTGTSGVAQAHDPAAREKRLKKIPEYNLGLALRENGFKDEDNLFKYVMEECGNIEVDLAKEIAEHEVKVEQMVYAQFHSVTEQELPSIAKAKKHLTKCINDRENANSRYLSMQKQSDSNPGFQASKVSQAKVDLEDADTKAEQAIDNFAIEMFKLLSKEINFVNLILQYLKLQKAYHESALYSLKDVVPRLEKCINMSTSKPIFGFPIEDHLRVTGRTIAYPIELCVCSLHELALEEEGLFRITGGNTRMKRMKLSLDAGMFHKPLLPQYRDVHVLAGVLKSYLRELPEPLLTSHLYDSFVSAITKNSTEESRLNALWEVIHQLPEPNIDNLRYLIKFLSVLSKNQTINKMTPSNIAIVIAPNLLWCDNDGGGVNSRNMFDTTSINCVLELLIKHADWFFKDEINFFMTLSKEELLPDLYEYGFTPSFGHGIYNKSFNPNDPPNGDYSMSKSMYEYNEEHGNPSTLMPKQTHSRSNSHDSSMILVENDFKRAQSNTSLTENSSPPPDSPKLVPKRKNKPIAPVPPNFVPPDKNKDVKTEKNVSISKNIAQNKDTNWKVKYKNDVEKPDKPPRPSVPESMRPISVQTINRSTYKSRQLNRIGNKLSSSRENLSTERRNSSDFEHVVTAKPEVDAIVVNCVDSIVVQHGTVGKMAIGFESNQDVVTTPTPASPKQIQLVEPAVNSIKPIKPVATPRTTILALRQENASTVDIEGAEVQLRPKSVSDISSLPVPGNKPAIPERPAMLRPSSFRNSTHKNASLEILNILNDNSQNLKSGETLLERTHVYSVDKQQPTIINVGRLSDPSVISPEESSKLNVQRTNSNGPGVSATSGDHPPEQKPLTSQMRKLSQSEGNILDVPPSPRPYQKLPRPQIPAPPPPTAFASSQQPPAVIESTNL